MHVCICKYLCMYANIFLYIIVSSIECTNLELEKKKSQPQSLSFNTSGCKPSILA